MQKILLHCCCAVCGAYPYFMLKDMGYKVILYFYNPNIYPEEEYKRRLSELKKFSEINNVPLIIEKDTYSNWLEKIKGYEKEPEKGKRCEICFKERLSKAILCAKSNNIRLFTTTLTVSPHKNSKQIFEIGNSLSDDETKFLEIDFKKKDGFRNTSQLANEYGFYRQQYCGCEFSIRK